MVMRCQNQHCPRPSCHLKKSLLDKKFHREGSFQASEVMKALSPSLHDRYLILSHSRVDADPNNFEWWILNRHKNQSKNSRNFFKYDCSSIVQWIFVAKQLENIYHE